MEGKDMTLQQSRTIDKLIESKVLRDQAIKREFMAFFEKTRRENLCPFEMSRRLDEFKAECDDLLRRNNERLIEQIDNILSE